MTSGATDPAAAIRTVVEDWALWRDAGDWERFRTVGHEDGWMTATWFQGSARDVIEVCREGFERGTSILHLLSGFTVDVAGPPDPRPGPARELPRRLRHLGYLQTKAGLDVQRGLPGLTGGAVERLYAEGRAWLQGSPGPGVPL